MMSTLSLSVVAGLGVDDAAALAAIEAASKEREIVDLKLTIGGDSSVGQQAINLAIQALFDALTRCGERVRVTTLTVQPFVMTPLLVELVCRMLAAFPVERFSIALFEGPTLCSPSGVVRQLLQAMARAPRLTDLSLTSLFGRITMPNAAALRGDVMACFTNLQHLRSLELKRTDRRYQRTQIGAMLARSLSSTVLESLTLDGEEFAVGDVPLLVALMDRQPRLTRLEAAGAFASFEGPTVLLAAARHPALRVLNVDYSGNGIDAGVERLLRQSTTIEELSLLGTNVDQAALFECVAESTQLRVLRLSRFTDGGEAVFSFRSMLQLVRRNTTLNELHGMMICNHEHLPEELVNAFEDNFALHHVVLPLPVEATSRFLENRARLCSLLNRNRRIVKWTAMRERVLEIALAFADLRLPPYVLEEIVDLTAPAMTATRHWLKIRVLIGVQRFQNQLDSQQVSVAAQ